MCVMNVKWIPPEEVVEMHCLYHIYNFQSCNSKLVSTVVIGIRGASVKFPEMPVL